MLKHLKSVFFYRNTEKNGIASDVQKGDISPKREEDCETLEKPLDASELNYDEEEEDLQSSDPQIYEPVIEITAARKRPRSELSESDMLRNMLKRQRDVPEEEDEDKMFLLSLLSSFKKMDEDVKLATRIEVLQVVKRNLHAVYFPGAPGSTPRI